MADARRADEKLQYYICYGIRLLRVKHMKPDKIKVIKHVVSKYGYLEKEVLDCFNFLEQSGLIYSKKRPTGYSYFVQKDAYTETFLMDKSKLDSSRSDIIRYE